MERKLSIVVGLSGGVDSRRLGGLAQKTRTQSHWDFHENWNDPESLCRADEDYSYVEKVCRYLDIPYYTISFEKEYSRKVFDLMVDGYRKGRIPQSRYSL